MMRLIAGAFGAAALVLSLAGAALAGPKVAFDTSAGRFVVELAPKKAPKTVANFLRYVEDGHYDGTVFHRVIPNFMAQGGGFAAQDGAYVEKPTRAPIANEAGNGLSNARGTLAMARTSDPDSATSQFFINFRDNDFLDRAKARDKVGYAVFGAVVEGMAVIDAMASAPTAVKTLSMRAPNGSLVEAQARDVPREDIVIRSARVVK